MSSDIRVNYGVMSNDPIHIIIIEVSLNSQYLK